MAYQAKSWAKARRVVLVRVKRQVEAIIGDRYASANRALSDLIGIDLSKYGYHRR